MKTDKKGPVSSSKHNEKYTSSISVYQYINISFAKSEARWEKMGEKFGWTGKNVYFCSGNSKLTISKKQRKQRLSHK